jgi:hypothetical protein
MFGQLAVGGVQFRLIPARMLDAGLRIVRDRHLGRPAKELQNKQPFQRRALIAAVYSGKIYVLGGFDAEGNVVRAVSVYDPGARVWSNGPALPGKQRHRWLCLCRLCAQWKKLYVSVADGNVYGLNEPAERWVLAGRANPRVAHRMVSYGEGILVFGGAQDGNNLDLMEALRFGK